MGVYLIFAESQIFYLQGFTSYNPFLSAKIKKTDPKKVGFFYV